MTRSIYYVRHFELCSVRGNACSLTREAMRAMQRVKQCMQCNAWINACNATREAMCMMQRVKQFSQCSARVYACIKFWVWHVNVVRLEHYIAHYALQVLTTALPSNRTIENYIVYWCRHHHIVHNVPRRNCITECYARASMIEYQISSRVWSSDCELQCYNISTSTRHCHCDRVSLKFSNDDRDAQRWRRDDDEPILSGVALRNSIGIFAIESSERWLGLCAYWSQRHCQYRLFLKSKLIDHWRSKIDNW